MKAFKSYSVAELKLIAKSWNHHMKINYAKMKKAELVLALETHLKHDEHGEIHLKSKEAIKLNILDTDLIKFITNHADSSLKYHISLLYKHNKRLHSNADERTGQQLEKMYKKAKKLKTGEAIAESIIEEIGKLIE